MPINWTERWCVMGYVDCDTHVIEPGDVWDYFDPAERHLRPAMADGWWTVGDQVAKWPGPMMQRWREEVFPGSDLVDVPARLRHMDAFGVDVQILFTSWWLLYPTGGPALEAALHRSYNRWAAGRTADSGGRLRWAAMVPVRTMARALEELQFARDNNASSVFLLGQNHGMSLAEPAMFPLYEKAQELDLPITVHVGNDLRSARKDPGNALYEGVMVVPGAFCALLVGGVPRRFPRLRWAFIEAGASWVPFALREIFRADETGVFRSFRNWRECAAEALAETNLYVAAQVDDDLPTIIDLLGEDRVLFGTDYGHLDVGSDPDGLHLMNTCPDLTPRGRAKVVSANARQLFGIDNAFEPAPTPTQTVMPRERIALGLPG